MASSTTRQIIWTLLQELPDELMDEVSRFCTISSITACNS
ncbi:hypothetical protein TPY_1545 [Sulfobacillus acidophilus TPY]|nr:hypothetical protein TPY_1545 [Sulfobacillus acidophilus TPY]